MRTKNKIQIKKRIVMLNPLYRTNNFQQRRTTTAVFLGFRVQSRHVRCMYYDQIINFSSGIRPNSIYLNLRTL